MVIKKPKILGCFNVSFIFQLMRFQTFSFFPHFFLGSCRNRIELMSILLFTTIVPKLRYISYIIYNLPMLSVGREWEENFKYVCIFDPCRWGFFLEETAKTLHKHETNVIIVSVIRDLWLCHIWTKNQWIKTQAAILWKHCSVAQVPS